MLHRILLLPVILTFISLLTCRNNSNRQPNVILMTIDDKGYSGLECHGNPIIKTPDMDRLWEESVRLTSCHATPAYSSTRAALLTGRYNNRTDVWYTITGRSGVREDEITRAQLYSDNGYKTGMFGKRPPGFSYAARPMDKGFSTAVYHDGGGTGNTPHYRDNDYFADQYMVNGEYVQFEGGRRTPCFIYGQDGGMDTGIDICMLTAHIDILPTLVEIC
ncbi:MAG TPA: sulfatase-like hydrolase/transferase [Bacteroidales bacterium]|nr:sulfatase-like hydrolase/transferase [Bacteroidales bacterium]